MNYNLAVKLRQQVSLLSISAIFFYSAVSINCFGAYVGLLRLYDATILLAHFHKIANPLICLLALLILLNMRKVKIDLLSSILFFLAFQGVIFGIAYRGAPRYFISHAFSAFFAALMYTAARNIPWEKQRIASMIRCAAFLFLSTFLLVTFVFWSLRILKDHPVYLGIGTGAVLLPFALALIDGKYLNALLAIAVVFLSGKRGVLLSIPLIFGMTAVGIRRFELRIRLGILTLVCPLLICLFFYATSIWEVSLQEVPIFGSVYSKIMLLNFFSDGYSLDRLNFASGGRVLEISNSFREFQSNSIHYLTGGGFGWVYDSPFSHLDVSHYVHFSPLNYLYQYGILSFTILFGILIHYLITWGKRLSLYGREPFALWLALLGWLVVGFTGYNYAIDPMLWVSLGVVSSFCSSLKTSTESSS
ncbi:MAG: hypothetical protein AAGD09_00745 [Cyanobacteria bacterium P01_F01_bin.56]